MATWMATKTVKVIQQFMALKRAFPNSEGDVRKNRLQWKCTLVPTPMSEEYLVNLEYSLEISPKVFVVKPPLQEKDGVRPPHRYGDGSLCLYLPGEWDQSMLLADTIVPWTSEWLAHYEFWLATGEWQGGGVHPGDSPKAVRRERKSHPRTTQ
jgi:hypothetical protein